METAVRTLFLGLNPKVKFSPKLDSFGFLAHFFDTHLKICSFCVLVFDVITFQKYHASFKVSVFVMNV